MTRRAIQSVDTTYIRLIQQQQIALTLIRAERDAAVRDRDRARAEATARATLLDAVLASLRPYGFGRKRFLSEIRKAARSIPNDGPEAVQHAVLFEGSKRILSRSAVRTPSPDNV